jgi:iron complex transport system substrate-binding protein
MKLVSRLFLVGWMVTASVGCDSRTAAGAAQVKRRDAGMKVASLVPAATDLIVGMGAADHLVAVSNYDAAEIGSRVLPRVGDYQTTDWETLARLKPDLMLIQMDVARLPPGFAAKADRLGIAFVNVRLNTLTEVLAGSRVLGKAIGEPAKGEALAMQLTERIEGIQARYAGSAPVNALLALDAAGESFVGEGTFLDDLLHVAGGRNAAAALGGAWPSADRETLLRLRPEAVIMLKPRAATGTPAEAKQFWAGLPGVPAGQTGRVSVIGESWALLPGAHVAEEAEAIAQALHHAEEGR